MAGWQRLQTISVERLLFVGKLFGLQCGEVYGGEVVAEVYF